MLLLRQGGPSQDGELQVLLQRRSANPAKKRPVEWGVVGGSLDPAEKQHSRGGDQAAAWYARRRAALREAVLRAPRSTALARYNIDKKDGGTLSNLRCRARRAAAASALSSPKSLLLRPRIARLPALS